MTQPAWQSWQDWDNQWTEAFSDFVASQMQNADAGHDIHHIHRVVANARIIGIAEQAIAQVVLPAAWLHDVVVVAKDSPKRSQASRMAAEAAVAFLQERGYPIEYHAAIHHAIAAHSFSAGIPPETCEAKVVQDADRLEALGALGLARCLMTGVAMGTQLMHPEEPFPVRRTADDTHYSVDHLFVKLLKLPTLMQTSIGKKMARQRAEFLIVFLEALQQETHIDRRDLEQALERLTLV